MKKRGLGRNLDVLLSRPKSAAVAVAPEPVAVATPAVAVVASNNNELRKLPIELLQRGRYQPRKEFASDRLQELADSIRTQGIIQPIVVRPIAENRYEIIAGERRWRAAQLAGLTEVPVIIKKIPDEAALAVALIENIQREDLNPLEEAVALQRLLDEFGMTHEKIAQAVGKSRATVTNLLRLLSLQPEVKTLVEQGKLEMGHARALLALTGVTQTQLAKKVVAASLSVRETERLVKQAQMPKVNNVIKKADPNITHLQQKLSDQLGALVVFQHGAKGKGKMVVHYNNLDELEGILAKIR